MSDHVYTREEFDRLFPDVAQPQRASHPRRASHGAHRQPEYEEQCKLFAWRDIMVDRYPPLRFMFATANGLRMSPGVIAKAKAAGLLNKGLPDVIFLYPVGYFSGYAFEMKAGDNKCTPEQEEWLTYLQECGFKVAVHYSAEEAQAGLIAYLEAVK